RARTPFGRVAIEDDERARLLVTPSRHTVPVLSINGHGRQVSAARSVAAQDPAQEIPCRSAAPVDLVVVRTEQPTVRVYQVRRTGVVVEHSQRHLRGDGSGDGDNRGPRVCLAWRTFKGTNDTVPGPQTYQL